MLTLAIFAVLAAPHGGDIGTAVDFAYSRTYRESPQCIVDSRARGGSPDLDCEIWENDADIRADRGRAPGRECAGPYDYCAPKGNAGYDGAVADAIQCMTATSWVERDKTTGAWVGVCGDDWGNPLFRLHNAADGGDDGACGGQL